jgi:hypothetical protein
MASNHYIYKTRREGVKLLTINDIKSKLFSVKVFLEAKEDGF